MEVLQKFNKAALKVVLLFVAGVSLFYYGTALYFHLPHPNVPVNEGFLSGISAFAFSIVVFFFYMSVRKNLPEWKRSLISTFCSSLLIGQIVLVIAINDHETMSAWGLCLLILGLTALYSSPDIADSLGKTREFRQGRHVVFVLGAFYYILSLWFHWGHFTMSFGERTQGWLCALFVLVFFVGYLRRYVQEYLPPDWLRLLLYFLGYGMAITAVSLADSLPAAQRSPALIFGAGQLSPALFFGVAVGVFCLQMFWDFCKEARATPPTL